MAHPIWPFYELRVVTPRLELLPIDDEVEQPTDRARDDGPPVGHRL